MSPIDGRDDGWARITSFEEFEVPLGLYVRNHGPLLRSLTLDSTPYADLRDWASTGRVVQPDSAASVHAEYDAIAFYTRRHLDRYLRGDESAEADLAAGSIPDALGVTGQIESTPGTPLPPREADLLSWMRPGRADHALRRVRETLAREPEARPVDPGAAFTVAYFLQRTGDWAQVADAARRVPESAPQEACPSSWASPIRMPSGPRM